MCAVLSLCKYSNYCMNNIMNMLPGNKKPQNNMFPLPYMVMNPLLKHSNWLSKHRQGIILTVIPQDFTAHKYRPMTLDFLTQSTLRLHECNSMLRKQYKMIGCLRDLSSSIYFSLSSLSPLSFCSLSSLFLLSLSLSLSLFDGCYNLNCKIKQSCIYYDNSFTNIYWS